jgi:hypothetical protein
VDQNSFVRSLVRLERDMQMLPPFTISLLVPAFHPVLDVVVLGSIVFEFKAGGEVAATHNSVVSSTGTYKSSSDFVRAAFEILLLVWNTTQLVREVQQIIKDRLKYLMDIFNWLDLASIAAVYFGACMC